MGRNFMKELSDTINEYGDTVDCSENDNSFDMSDNTMKEYL